MEHMQTNAFRPVLYRRGKARERGVPIDERETTDRAPCVLIIDAMAVVQCIKKTPIMTSILHLKTAFNARFERMVIAYMDVRVIFDRYVEGSLKEKTRKKRTTYVAAATAGHVVHDGMSINTISLKQLLSCTSTKHSQADLLS